MFGQVVIGPPGAGKSTYCHGMYQFMAAIGRNLCVINLDPANDRTPYPCALDIRDFITLEEVMESEHLGPNGGLMYALEALDESEVDIFAGKVQQLLKDKNYLIFDCPGQVELFTLHNLLFRVFKRLKKTINLQLCVVSLVDSIYLTSPSQYISVLLLCLRLTLQFDLPHINVISKIDMLKNYGPLPFKLDYYTEVQDLQYLAPYLEKELNSILGRKYVKLSQMIGEVVEDFNLVSFEVLSVENKQAMVNLLSVIDKAVGYSFGSTEVGGDSVWSEATRVAGLPGYKEIDIHERWIDFKEKYDDEERKAEEMETEEEVAETEDEEWARMVRESEMMKTKR